MTSRTAPSGDGGLRGRARECEELLSVVNRARSGHSAVIVVHGDPGIGKTALLDFAQANSRGCRSVRVAGVEAEMELPYAGLHQLCVPFLDRAESLPPPQRAALATAFGASSGPPPDRFMVGLAILTLIADLATDRPLVLVIDDVQWMDGLSAQVLAFVARRLQADPVAMIFGTRTQADSNLRGLPELPLAGLDRLDAGALLDAVVPGRLDDSVRSRLLDEAHGNPLALVELPRSLDADLAPALIVPDPRPVTARIEDQFVRQIQGLPPNTRRLLLLAAIERFGDAAVLWLAAAQQGIDPADALPAESADLLTIRGRVLFRHPLIRSAIRRSASLDEEREAHAALAAVIEAEPDRRAWHRALATAGTDEELAAELETSAERARRRGGVAEEAAFLARAVALTPDPQRRAQRALAAAAAKLRAGATEDCLEFLSIIDAESLSALDRARIALLEAQARFAADRGRTATPLLLAAARRLEPLDPQLARETYLDAISAAMFAGRLADATDVEDVAHAARAALQTGSAAGLGDELLRGLATLFTEGYRAAVPVGTSMLRHLQERRAGSPDLPYLWLAAATAADLWDDASWEAVADEHVRITREIGALGELPLALNSRAMVHVFAGELNAAAALVAEVPTVTESTGTDMTSYGAMGLAAWRGDESAAGALIAASREDAMSRGEGVGVSASWWASALVYVGRGRFDEALTAAQQAVVDTRELAVPKWGLAELVEAGVRVGERRVAAEAFDRLATMTSAAGSDWALGVEARARALVTDDRTAEDHYLEAIEHLGRTRMRTELARAHLLYGEWLWDQDRRAPARDHLEAAHDLFEDMGAGAFAARARRALLEAGLSVSPPRAGTPVDLTDQETQIAQLASEGLTNPEIGARLFLSPHTVEWHLRKVYKKLGIRGRRQLRESLAKAQVTPA